MGTHLNHTRWWGVLLALLWAALILFSAQDSPVGAQGALTPTPTLFFPTPVLVTTIPEPVVPINISINGLSAVEFVVMPPAVIENIWAIFGQGIRLGRNPRAFSKLGDSTIENPFFMSRFDEGGYHLGEYGYLEPTLNYFRGSFSRTSIAVKRGLRVASVFDPFWTENPLCRSDEGVLPCEIRIHNPAVIFIRLGSNDTGRAELIQENFRNIVQYCIQQGVIPILGTKADRHEGSDLNNQIMRQVAKEFSIPLWDWDLLSATVPGRGLWSDNVHLTTFSAYDWRQSLGFKTGYGVHNLSAIIALDAVRRGFGG